MIGRPEFLLLKTHTTLHELYTTINQQQIGQWLWLSWSRLTQERSAVRVPSSSILFTVNCIENPNKRKRGWSNRNIMQEENILPSRKTSIVMTNPSIIHTYTRASVWMYPLNTLKAHSHYCIFRVCLRQMVAFLQGDRKFPISALTQSTAENADRCI